MSTPQSDQNTSKEGRILLAIRAFQNGQFSSIRAAAYTYNVSRSTLIICLQGHPAHTNSTSNNQKLISTKESAFVEQILSINQYNLLLQATTVQQIANLLLAEQLKSTLTTLLLENIGSKTLLITIRSFNQNITTNIIINGLNIKI